MPPTKISAATGAGALAGTEEVPVNDGGASAKTTVGAIATLATLMKLRPPAGSAAADSEPLALASGPLLTTPEAGAFEYLTGIPYFSPVAGARAILAAQMFAAIQGDFTLAASAAAQNCLTAANDTITLPAATAYWLEGQYIINSGATTHTTAMLFAGTATLTSLEYFAECWVGSVNALVMGSTATTSWRKHCSGAAAQVLTATNTAVYTLIKFRGVLRINGAGTFIPQIQFSANPTGTNLMKVGSYISLVPIGSNTVAFVGPWT